MIGEGAYKTLYKVYALLSEREAIRDVIARYFDGYTIIDQARRVIFEVISDHERRGFERDILTETGRTAARQVVNSRLIEGRGI